MAHLLSTWGYETLAARDGLDALEKLNDFAADTVITDLNMPNLDGAGLLATTGLSPETTMVVAPRPSFLTSSKRAAAFAGCRRMQPCEAGPPSRLIS